MYISYYDLVPGARTGPLEVAPGYHSSWKRKIIWGGGIQFMTTLKPSCNRGQHHASTNLFSNWQNDNDKILSLTGKLRLTGNERLTKDDLLTISQAHSNHNEMKVTKDES